MDVNILDCGAVGDGGKLNTKAIQDAIDRCHKAGVGRVVVPPGVFHTGSIRLTSGVELHVARGGVPGGQEPARLPRRCSARMAGRGGADVVTVCALLAISRESS